MATPPSSCPTVPSFFLSCFLDLGIIVPRLSCDASWSVALPHSMSHHPDRVIALVRVGLQPRESSVVWHAAKLAEQLDLLLRRKPGADPRVRTEIQLVDAR